MIYLFLLICMGGAALLFYMYRQAYIDQVVRSEMTFSDFPGSFGKITIFFISDIHKRIVANDIIGQIKDHVDFVIIGGDLLEKGVPLDRVERNIRRLKKLGPVYFVWGNNDYEGNEALLAQIFERHDVTVLKNTAVIFESDEGERFVIMGVDDATTEKDRLDLALQEAGNEGFRVLVSHHPKVLKQILPEHRISLVLSGHTHGGQIRIFGIGPYEKGGLSEKNGIKILVSNGYGTTALPLRLGAKPEMHLIQLKRAEK